MDTMKPGDRVSLQEAGHPMHERIGTVRSLRAPSVRHRSGTVLVEFDGSSNPGRGLWPADPQQLELLPYRD